MSTLEPTPPQPPEEPESNNATHMGFQQTVMYGEYSKALGELAKKEARQDIRDALVMENITVLVLRMAHRKWKETKQQPSMLPGSAEEITVLDTE